MRKRAAQTPDRGRAARRRRSSVRLLGHAGRRGQGLARVTATGRRAPSSARSARRCRRSERTRRRSRSRPAASCGSWRSARPRLCASGRRPLRRHAGRLARRHPRRPHARDGDAAGGVPGHAHGLPRARGVAHLAAERSDAAHARASRPSARPPVLCVDKTGTLTENRMTVGGSRGRRAFDVRPARAEPLPEEFHALVEFAHPREPAESLRSDGAGVQRARDGAALRHRAPPRQLDARARVSAVARAAGHVARLAAPRTATAIVIAAKGAPEAIAICATCPPERAPTLLARRCGALADGAARAGVARRSFGATRLPPGQHDFDFELLGLVGSPIRSGETVPAPWRSVSGRASGSS